MGEGLGWPIPGGCRPNGPGRLRRVGDEHGFEVEAGKVGLDAGRLARIDRHFQRYVDDGRLAGWCTLVSRHGQVAHLSTYGMRDRERSLPVETDTIWRL